MRRKAGAAHADNAGIPDSLYDLFRCNRIDAAKFSDRRIKLFFKIIFYDNSCPEGVRRLVISLTVPETLEWTGVLT